MINIGSSSFLTECHRQYGFCHGMFTTCPKGYVMSDGLCRFLQVCCLPQTSTITSKTTTNSIPFSTTTAITTSTPSPTTGSCGHPLKSTHHRIVGGHDTVIMAYPWQVSLRYNGQHFCGGTLIDDRWILTAAHCILFLPQDTIGVTVAMGMEDLRQDAGHVHAVRKAIYNADYDTDMYFNDIALVKLVKPVDITGPLIQPACLPSPSEQFYQETCTATGWGDLQYEGESPTRLQEVDLTIFSDWECRTLIERGHYDLRKICAGDRKGGKSTCNGDSGGPLACDTKTGWKVAGITSSGYSCGSRPSMYTRVERYLDWIEVIKRKYSRA